jgi:hypothetical protein
MTFQATTAEIDFNSFQEEAATLLSENKTEETIADDFQNLFKIQPANQWIDESRTRPAPKMLCGEFWYEGELCILFADTNTGKSILAVQIGEKIATGDISGLLGCEADPQQVIYIDFELSDKQFEGRYSQKEGNFFTNHYLFSKNFLRAEIDPSSFMPSAFDNFEDYLNFSIKHAVSTTGAKTLIIDNLTYLRNETEKAKDALPLMKELKKLKSEFGLSILALAHTPKRDISKPLSKNDLQGSKMLINFCDSSFAIGESQEDRGRRYLKQIKVRNSEFKYDGDNVAVCDIVKPTNFLQFDFIDYGREKDHLKSFTEEERSKLIAEAKDLANGSEKMSQRDIAKKLNISLTTVNRYLSKE